MLNDTGPIHAKDIRDRDRIRLLIDLDHDPAEIIIEAGPQDVEGRRGRQHGRQLGAVGGAALRVERVVLEVVDGPVVVEGARHVLLDVQRVDHGVEDAALVRGGGGARRAVGCGVRAQFEVGGRGVGEGVDGVGEGAGEGEEGGGREGREEGGGEAHFFFSFYLLNERS